PPDRIYRQVAEGYLTGWLRRGRELTGVDWTPRIVRFRHPQPPRVDNHQRFFRSPISFADATDELELDRELLALPIRSSEPRLALILDQYAKDMLDRLPAQGDLARRVRQAVAQLLTGGEPTLDTVAVQMGMSTRTLQRRLYESALSF